MLNDYITSELPKYNTGVHKLCYNSRLYWLKIGGESKTSLLRRMIKKLSKFELLSFLSTNSTLDSYIRLKHEIKIIDFLYDKGCSVPKIVSYGERYFVTEGAGQSLSMLSKSSLDSKVLYNIIHKLKEIHANGVAHGRLVIRDIIVDVKSSSITFVDFEESILNASDKLKVRDFLFFIMDLQRLEFITINDKIKILDMWISLSTKQENYELKKLFVILYNLRFLAYIIKIFKPKNKLVNQVLSISKLYLNYREHNL
ncbi:BUD32 family EKC/KEOPS complex subunit [Photobacterium leiognathi]|uniref:hypothetical protein n=1 Tax=Photobacterium leiognathi TaxID=553611 RepID=UPI0011B24278|nr:hypothetical protein [Photobacterium leiognathi]